MTPKEKAKELIAKFLEYAYSDANDNQKTDAIQCALICVDEIIESSPSLPILSDNGTYGSDIEESSKFWQEVKQEILNQ